MCLCVSSWLSGTVCFRFVYVCLCSFAGSSVIGLYQCVPLCTNAFCFMCVSVHKYARVLAVNLIVFASETEAEI